MTTATVEILSDATNLAVMRHPGRRFPGLLIQGDTLSTLGAAAREVRARIGQADEDLEAAADNLLEFFRTALEHYEAVLAEHGVALPYSRQ